MSEQNHTFKQQIECVESEIRLRERGLPLMASLGQGDRVKADYELACMKSVLHTLQNLNRQYEEATK